MSMMPEEDQLAMREELRRNLPQVRPYKMISVFRVTGMNTYFQQQKNSGKKNIILCILKGISQT